MLILVLNRQGQVKAFTLYLLLPIRPSLRETKKGCPHILLNCTPLACLMPLTIIEG